MNKEQFLGFVFENVCKGLTDHFKEDELRIYREQREDGTSCTTLKLSSIEKHFSAFFDMDILYEEYLTGSEVDEIVDGVIEIGKMIATSMAKVDFNDMEDFEKVKDGICLCLRSKDNKKPRAEKQITEESEYFYTDYFVCLGKIGRDGVLHHISEEHLEKWGKSREEVFSLALANQEKNGILFFPLEKGNTNLDIIRKKNCYGKNIPEDKAKGDTSFCLTTYDCQNGASLMLNGSVLKNVHSLLGRNYYFFPASIHELIVLPDIGLNYEDTILDFVRHINETNAPWNEKVCEMAFYYDGEAGNYSPVRESKPGHMDNMTEEKGRLLREFLSKESA